MVIKQKSVALSGMVIFVILGIAATHFPDRNLKVLPKDISDEKLDSIMHTYSKALGVTCDFCHTAQSNVPDSLNYASDQNPMKEEARKMMRLTIGINKEYFYFDSTRRPEYLNVVTCITCHRRDPMPVDIQ